MWLVGGFGFDEWHVGHWWPSDPGAENNCLQWPQTSPERGREREVDMQYFDQKVPIQKWEIIIINDRSWKCVLGDLFPFYLIMGVFFRVNLGWVVVQSFYYLFPWLRVGQQIKRVFFLWIKCTVSLLAGLGWSRYTCVLWVQKGILPPRDQDGAVQKPQRCGDFVGAGDVPWKQMVIGPLVRADGGQSPCNMRPYLVGGKALEGPFSFNTCIGDIGVFDGPPSLRQ